MHHLTVWALLVSSKLPSFICDDIFEHHDDITVTGGSVRTINVWSFVHCACMCTIDLSCQAISYDTNMCHLHDLYSSTTDQKIQNSGISGSSLFLSKVTKIAMPVKGNKNLYASQR